MSPQEMAFILKMHDEATATLRKIGHSLRGVGDEAGDAAKDTEKLGDRLDRLKKVAVDTAVAVGGIWASMSGVRSANSAFGSYELGLIGVQKTTDMTKRELQDFSLAFDDLNARMNGIDTTTLFGMAESFGQMGTRGTKDLLAATEVMGKLGVTTDIVGDQGARSVGRLLTITENGVKNVRQFGDSLNWLGNNTAATEGEILQMATTMASSTAGMGLTTDALLALSAASKQVGLPDELTGSAFGRTLRNLRDGSANATKGFQTFLDVTGMTKDQFDALAASNPEQVLIRFGEAYAALLPTGKGSGFLDQLGLNTDEIKRVFGTVGAQASEFQKRLVALQQGEQVGALDAEADKFFGASANEVKALAKSWDLVKAAVGEALAPLTGPIISGTTSLFTNLAGVIRGMPEPLRTAVSAIALMTPGIMGAVKAAGLLRLGFQTFGGTGLGKVLGYIGSLAGRVKEGATAMLGFNRAAAGVGPTIGLFTRMQATLGVISGLFRYMGGMAGVFNVIRTAVMGVGVALGGLVSLPALIIAAVVGAGIAIIANWDKVRDFLTKSPKEIVSAIGEWFGSLPGVVGNALADLGGVVVGAFDAALTALGSAWDTGVRFVFETIPNIDWGKLGKELITGFTGAVKGALRSAGDAITEWWNSPLWAKNQTLDVAVTPKVDTDAAKKALAAGQQTGALNTEVEIAGVNTGTSKTIEDVVKALRVQVDEAKALTGTQKDRIELEGIIRDAVEQTGVKYDEVKARVSGVVDELQRARQAAAVLDVMRGYDDQIAAALAVTGEQKVQVDVQRQINDLEREHRTLTAETIQALRDKANAALATRTASAYDQLFRDTNQQLAALRAVTVEEKNRLEVVQQILAFEREYRRLSDDERRNLATRLLQVRQIADYQRMAEQYDPVGTARRRYDEEVKTLEVMRQQGVVSAEVYARMKQNLELRTRGQRDPLGDRIQFLREELSVLGFSIERQGMAGEVLDEVNRLRQQGVEVTQAQTQAISEYVIAMDDYRRASTQGIGGWINEVGPLRDNMMALTKDFASGLSGAISGVLAGDKNAFRNFFQQLGRKMIDTGVNQLMSEAFKELGLANPQQKALDRADAALAKLDALNQAGINTPQAIINAGSVNINGQALDQALRAANDNLGNRAANDNGGAGVPNLSGIKIDEAVGQRAASAVDAASQVLGAHEQANRSKVNGFLREGGVNIDAAMTAWCAGFVNSALKQVGVDGSGKLTASSFLTWGQKIDPMDAMRGDVLVDHRGRQPGQTGAHVGFATGNSREVNGRRQLEMLSGNESNRVQTSWYDQDKLAVRRATEGMGNQIDTAQLTQATQQVQQATQQLSTSLQNVNLQVQQATMGVQQLDMATQQAGSTTLSTGEQFAQASQQIQQAGAAASATQGTEGGSGGAGGIAGIAGSIGGMFKGGGGKGGIGGILGMVSKFLPPPFNMLGSLLSMFRDGGMIDGPGSGTSDSILARVSKGEFIVNAKSTKEWAPMLQAINDNTLPKFRNGGRVGGNVIAMGERGMISGRKGGSGDLSVLADQVDNLSRAVGKSQGNGRGRVNNNSLSLTVNARDADSFRRSEGQLLADASTKLARLNARNN